MWIIIVAVLGGLIAVLLLILAVPLDLAFGFQFYGQPRFNLRWSWGFGLISREVPMGKRKSEKPKKPRKAKKAAPKEKSSFGKTIRNIQTVLDFLRTRGLIGQVLRFMKNMRHSFRLRQLEADWTVGLDDPAETFYLFVLTEPVNRLLDYFQPYPVYIHPSFIEPVIEGYCRGEVRIYPIRTLPPLFILVFSLPVFRLIKKVVALKWRKNR